MKKYILSSICAILSFSASAQWNVIEEHKISHLNEEAQMSCDSGYGHKENRPKLTLRFTDPVSSTYNVFVSYSTDKGHSDVYMNGHSVGGTHSAQLVSLPPSLDGFNDAMITAMKESNWITFTERHGGKIKLNLSGFTKTYNKMIEMCN